MFKRFSFFVLLFILLSCYETEFRSYQPTDSAQPAPDEGDANPILDSGSSSGEGEGLRTRTPGDQQSGSETSESPVNPCSLVECWAFQLETPVVATPLQAETPDPEEEENSPNEPPQNPPEPEDPTEPEDLDPEETPPEEENLEEEDPPVEEEEPPVQKPNLCAQVNCWDQLRLETPEIPEDPVEICEDIENKRENLPGGSHSQPESGFYLEASLAKNATSRNKYYDHIYAATENGIVQGDETLSGPSQLGSFSPNRDLARSEMTVMMLEAMRCLKNAEIAKKEEFESYRTRYINQKQKEEEESWDATQRQTYTDVKADKWYTPRIYEATLKGIVKGFADGGGQPQNRFHPNEETSGALGSVTNGQLCRMILTSMKHIYNQNPTEGGILKTLAACDFTSEDGRTFPKTLDCLKAYSQALNLPQPICNLALEGGLQPTQNAKRDFAAAMSYRMKAALIQENFGLKCADKSQPCTP